MFRHEFRFASGKICECPKGQGGSEWCGPMNKACTEYALRHTNKPLETRKNQNELLLQEDPLIFMLSCEYVFTSSNFTPGAHPSATSESTLSPSYSGFFRTDVPSSQYHHGELPRSLPALLPLLALDVLEQL